MDMIKIQLRHNASSWNDLPNSISDIFASFNGFKIHGFKMSTWNMCKYMFFVWSIFLTCNQKPFQYLKNFMKRYFTYLITIEQNLEDSFCSLFSDLNDLQVIGKCKSLQTAETQFDEQNCEQLSKTKRQQEIREKLKIRVNQIISDTFLAFFWHFWHDFLQEQFN